MPLITLAYLTVAAGLLLGFGGAVLLAVALAAAGLAVSVIRRSAVLAALSVLAPAAAAFGHAVARDDGICAREMVARGRAIARLSEEARPRRAARAIAVQAGCRVRLRVSADSGAAPAGALVDVRGDGRRNGDVVVFVNAHVKPLESPRVLARLRSRAGRVIDDLYGSHAPLARALLIADERDIAPEVRKAFADAGIIHMLSVSGLHVAVLAEAVALGLLLCGIGTRRAEFVALATTVAFVLFVGAPAPAVRAGAMYGALVVSRRMQRPTSPWALLALGAAMPLTNTRVVGDIGYQLSVVGMAGLIASGMVSRRLRISGGPRWISRIGRELLATIVASAVTAPIVAWHFGRISLAAPLTNLAAAPLFGLAQPALFLSLLCAPIKPLAQFVADGTGVLLSGITGVAASGAALPGAAVDLMPSAPVAVLVACAATLLLVMCASRQWVRPAAAGVGAVAAAVWWPLLAPASGRFEVHMLDVGQGDAIALRTPAGRWIAVDAGDAWRATDAGARIVAPYLRRRGGDVVALILTHPHDDHIGGAASLLRLNRVGVVLDGGFVNATDTYRSALTTARQTATPWRLGRANDTLMIDGVRLRILGPDSITAASASDANEASVVLLAEYRGARVLLTGDAERDEERRIVDRFGGGIRADILKVGHHGSATSSSDTFLDAVRPRVALVSVGAGNHYGHPSPLVLRSFSDRRVPLLRTDQDGTVVVSTDGKTIRIRTDDNSWELPVASRSP